MGVATARITRGRKTATKRIRSNARRFSPEACYSFLRWEALIVFESGKVQKVVKNRVLREVTPFLKSAHKL